MAKLADALDLGSSGATRAGSSPVISTKDNSFVEFFLFVKLKYLRILQNYQQNLDNYQNFSMNRESFMITG